MIVGPDHPAAAIILPTDPTTMRVLEKELDEWWADLDVRGKMWVCTLAKQAETAHQERN